VPIGDFSRMTHLSIKALRYYHDQGLLEPAEIDLVTGYRFYDPRQVPVAQVIRRFRDLGMPLDQVKAVLQAPDVDARNKEIAAHLTAMEHKLAEMQMTRLPDDSDGRRHRGHGDIGAYLRAAA